MAKENPSTLRGRARIIEAFVHHVTIYEDHIEIVFNYKNELSEFHDKTLESSLLNDLVTQKGFEPLAFWFVVKRSIQLSYWVMYKVLTYINIMIAATQAFFNIFWVILWTCGPKTAIQILAGAVGLEPTTNGFGDRYSTNWAIPLYSSSFAWYLISLTNITYYVKKYRLINQ